jgi:hypothetical protein
MMTDLALTSWETIARRSLLMAQNRCSPLEYHRMFSEKAMAAMEMGFRLASTGGNAPLTSLLTPWLKISKANSNRLRRRR